MKVLSLFDGISCGMVALKRIGISVEAYDAFEIDKYAITVSSRNHPEIVHHGNVFDGDFKKFKGYDLLLGGSPCTYWSIAKQGRETSCNGEGFKLFNEYVRALQESECRYFLYENNHSTPFTGISKMRFPKHLVLSQSSSILLWCQDSTESVVTGRIFPMLHNLRTKAFCCRMYWKTAFLGRIKATVSQPAIRVPLFITLWNESGVLWWLFLWKR